MTVVIRAKDYPEPVTGEPNLIGFRSLCQTTLMDFFFAAPGHVAGGGRAVMEFRPDFQRDWPAQVVAMAGRHGRG